MRKTPEQQAVIRSAEAKLRTWGVSVMRRLWQQTVDDWSVSCNRGALECDVWSLCYMYLDRLSTSMDPDYIVDLG